MRQQGRTIRGVAFGRAEWAQEIAAVRGPISISFAPSINRFQGRESVEIQLVDWKPEGAPAGTANPAPPTECLPEGVS